MNLARCIYLSSLADYSPTFTTNQDTLKYILYFKESLSLLMNMYIKILLELQCLEAIL